MNQCERMKQEAITRINTLINRLGFNPNVLKHFEEGKIYYSYLTCGGMIGSIDSVTYDERYSSFIKEFEDKTGSLVYHAIESQFYVGDELYETLALLFVSKLEDIDEWDYERLDAGNWIYAFVHNLDGYSSEYGSIKIEVFAESGALIRVG